MLIHIERLMLSVLTKLEAAQARVDQRFKDNAEELRASLQRSPVPR